MRSMTGYGRGECIGGDRKFIAEIKSVNHRYNDISVKIPRTMVSFEDSVKKIIAKEIFRGKTEVYISFETYSKDDIKINLNEIIADRYVETLKNIKERYNIEDNISLELVAKFPDVLTVEKNFFDVGKESEISKPLFCAVNNALSELIKMRESEGENLKKNILNKLVFINEKIKFIDERAPLCEKKYEERLKERLSELNDMGYDEGRIITEVALFAEKACIDEEITRLKSHISQMKLFMEETNSIGRKLDFLIQEINREINTIGSKATDLEITNNIVEVKSEIEKIREQIQNIE